MMAMEFKAPGLAVRQKEMMLNLACSTILPFDKDLEEILIDAV